jgi:hypothetical protein
MIILLEICTELRILRISDNTRAEKVIVYINRKESSNKIKANTIILAPLFKKRNFTFKNLFFNLPSKCL